MGRKGKTDNYAQSYKVEMLHNLQHIHIFSFNLIALVNQHHLSPQYYQSCVFVNISNFKNLSFNKSTLIYGASMAIHL